VSRELEEIQYLLLGFLAKRIEVTLGLQAEGVEKATQTLLGKIKVLHTQRALRKSKSKRVMFKAPKVQLVFLCLQEPKQTGRATIQKQLIII